MNEQKNIPGSKGRDLFLNRYLTSFIRDTEEILHSVLGGAYRNMACMEKKKCQEYLQYVADITEQLAGMLTEIKEGLCREDMDITEGNGTVDIVELSQNMIKELQLLYEGEEFYILTETGIRHAKTAGDRNMLLRLFTGTVISFIDYKGADGTVFLKLEEIGGSGNMAEFCFQIRKDCCQAEDREETERTLEDTEKERIFYLEMEKICHWLQQHDGTLEIGEYGYRMTFWYPVTAEEAVIRESRLYAMKDMRNEAADNEVIDLAGLRKRYAQFVGKRILLAVCGRYDLPLKELFELTGIRVEAVFDTGEAMQRIWWSESGEFDGVVIHAEKNPEIGIALARKIREMERMDTQQMPVVVIGGAWENKESGMATALDGVSFEKIMDMMCSGIIEREAQDLMQE